MFDRLAKFVTPPVFPDKEKNRQARWLYVFLSLFIVVLLAITLPLLFGGLKTAIDYQFLIVQTTIIVVFLGAFLLMRRGYVKPVAILVLAVVYFGTFYIDTYTFQTIYDPSIIGYFSLDTTCRAILRQACYV